MDMQDPTIHLSTLQGEDCGFLFYIITLYVGIFYGGGIN